jgi:hypothetical protein
LAWFADGALPQSPVKKGQAKAGAWQWRKV